MSFIQATNHLDMAVLRNERDKLTGLQDSVVEANRTRKEAVEKYKEHRRTMHHDGPPAH